MARDIERPRSLPIAYLFIAPAFAIVLLSLCWIVMAFLALSILQPQCDSLDVLFETVSAYSTVGLSRGVMPHLCALAKIVIITTMLVGRIGVLVFVLAFVKRVEPPRVILPEEHVIIA